MKKRYQTVAFLVLLLCPLFSFAQSGQFAHLEVLNPQRQWERYNGNIDELTFTVNPQGIYTEVGLYMNISDKGSGFNPGTFVEAVLRFSLPEEVIVNDSWLWVGDTIVRAQILDRWTASNIYEEIVDRNQDPSVLYKNSETEYELRIFPLPSGSHRRVKLNFLIPSTWSSEQVISSLPSHIALASSQSIKDLKLRIWENSTWRQPKLNGENEVFIKVQHPDLGNFNEILLQHNQFSQGLDISFAAPLKDGVFLQRFEKDGKQYYELAFLPSEVFQLVANTNRNLLVLLHYNPSNSNQISIHEVIRTAKTQLKTYLQEQDRFNIMLAGIDPQVVSTDWLGATDANIDSLFNSIDPSQIGSYNLPGLLAKGANYIKTSEAPSSLFLFANSGQEGDFATANQIIDDLLALMGDRVPPIYISDYQNANFQRFYANNRQFRGNQYFYTNLSQLTNGDFRSLLDCCQTLDQNTLALMDQALARIGTMDLYTSLQNGFCFNRYNLGRSSELVNLDQPVLQVGRYTGEFPFVIEAAGEYNDQVYLDALSVPITDINQGTDNTRYSWAGNHIKELEKEAAPNGFYGRYGDNKSIAEVIERSLKERILSVFTTFIALEPRLGGEPCITCADESGGITVSANETQLDSLLQIDILPNPFKERVQINLQFRTAQELADYQFFIFNGIGQEIQRFTEHRSNKVQNLSLEWDGTNIQGQSLAGGIYYFTIISPEGRFSKKLIKL